ncbi:MAG: sugar phosphate isomerase/epimerase [Clostridia bacterium]|nr:sugar phosphate isomerase/epimerase [Clostridia bacterium]
MNAASTTRVITRGYGARKYRIDEILRFLRQAGFTVVDWYAPACELIESKSSALDTEAWNRWAHGAREVAEKLGMRFSQMHSLELDRSLGEDHMNATEIMTDNALRAAAILGVRDVAIHPIIMEPRLRAFEQCIKYNVSRLRKKAELAGALGLRLALENMLTKRHFDGRQEWRFCTCIEEHEALLTAVDCENVGYCFDVGHANYTGTDICEAVTRMGGRLFAVHVHDNDTFSDQHLIPYQGNVDYEAFARALAHARYAGDMTMEVLNAANGMPPEMARHTLRAVYEAARHLISRVQYYCEEENGYAI